MRTPGSRPSRRTTLQRIGAIACLAAVPTSVNATEGTDVTLEHSPGGFREMHDGKTASVLRVAADGITLDPAGERSLQVMSESGETVTVTLAEPEPLAVTDADAALVLYDGAGKLREDPYLWVDGNRAAVDVTGATSMFEPEPIFEGYTVAYHDGDDVIASTDEQLYGIGYPIELSQSGTSGEIHVSLICAAEVTEEWRVELVIVDYDAESVATVQLRSEFEHEAEYLVTTIDTDELESLEEGAITRDIDVNFYVETDSGTMRNVLWGVADLELDLDGEPDVPSVDDYVDDESGTVETEGLRDAIDDWRAEEVDTDLLREVIDAWRSGGG